MTLLKIYNLEATEEVDVVCTLSEGEHVIGRGGILNCNDKRISRKHALINVGKDVVTIKAVHINPCFFKSVNGNSITILPKDTSVVLNDGDRFALLADLFWFRTKIIWNNDTGQDLDNSKTTLTSNGHSPTRKSESTIADAPSTSKRCHEEESTVNTKRTKISDENKNESKVDTDENVISNETISSRPTLPSNLDVLDGENDSNILKENFGANIDPNKLINNLKNIVEEDYGKKLSPDDNKKQKETSNTDELPGSNVTSNSNEVKIKQEAPDDQVKLKEEKLSDSEAENDKHDKGEPSNSSPLNSDKIKTEQTEESTSPRKDTDNSTENKQNDPSCSMADQKPKKTRRERCWYGSNCYRKNPEHRQDFSHPGDNDYDSDPEDDRPQCPFSGACYRKNLDHRRRYKHPNPPATKPSGDDGTTPKRKKKSPKKKPKTDDSSQDSSQNDDQTGDDGTTRRKRQAAKKLQTYNNPDSLDDYDYEDPFIDDASSDEFKISTDEDDSEESEWEDSQEVDEESQETRRLLKEAKRFTKGKGKKKD